MIKNLLKHIILVIIYSLLLGLVSPIYDMVNVLETYQRPSHWAICLITVLVVYPIFLYFHKINPREFYFCYNIPSVTVALTLSSVALIAGLIAVGIMEGILLKTLLMTMLGSVYLFSVYALVCRGVAIYKKGKVRIFKFRIKTYAERNTVDTVRFEYVGKKCTVHIVISGYEHTFRLSAYSAKLCEKRFDSLPKQKDH